MKIGYITNASSISGVGHRAWHMEKALSSKYGDNVEEIVIDGDEGRILINGEKEPKKMVKWPGILGSKSVNWARLLRKIKSNYEIVHATNQSLSLAAKRYERSIVTVHDIIEVKEPQDKRAELLNKYLYSGISKASRLVCVSEFTAAEVMEFYGIGRDTIKVIYNGVDTDNFYPIDGFEKTVTGLEWRRKLKIGNQTKVLLYVGSEHPRKNLETVIEVLAGALKQYPDTVFVKVGSPGIMSGREELLQAIDKHGVRDKVRFLKDLSGEQLNEIYNLGDAMIFPSRYEGFGFPPLQAMACGTPVITSDATSLAEVTGDDDKYGKCAALVKKPDDVEGMAEDVMRLFENEELAADLKLRGIERAKMFSWSKSTEQLIEVYESLI